MLLIYTDRQTNRLGYTVNLIFRDILKTEFMVTTSREQFIALGGAKLSYCESRIYDEVHICSADLLFETNIHSVETDCITTDGIPRLFPTYRHDCSLDFDIFAATFYMVSRYEEYLPFIRDEHSRFCASDSIAYQKHFIEKPVVNIWAMLLKKVLLEKYPDLFFEDRKFKFFNTIDVDMAYSYKNKGLTRNLGGWLRDLANRQFDLCKERIEVILNKRKDPFDCFEYILSMSKKHKTPTLFFILFALQRGQFDKNISPYNKNFQLLIKNLSDFAQTGIHPSYYTLEYPEQLSVQIKLMSQIIHKSITSSRFHYIRFSLPQSYRDLAENEISDDYSMGYADVVGFRAGICVDYNFYDLERDCETKLRIHPFAFMDVSLANGMKLDKQEVLQKIEQLIYEVRNVSGDFISIWHNESLSDNGQWSGWRNIYEKQFDYIYGNK